MTKDEALQQALILLVASTGYFSNGDPVSEQDEANQIVIDAIKAALAQPEQPTIKEHLTVEREIEIEFLEWVHPLYGVMPAKFDSGKPLVLRAKLKEKNT